MAFKDHIWSILNNDDDPRHNFFLSVINILIFCSVGLLIYETFNPKLPTETINTIRMIDYGILVVFGLEYLGRLWVIRDWKPQTVKLSQIQVAKYFVLSRLKFIFSPWGLIDFLALLPLVPFLRSLRILRLLRLFRSVQLFKYNSPLRTLMAAFRDNMLLFAVAFGFVFVCIVFSAVMFFFAEFGVNKNVTSLADTLWWSIVTITTVGFGDITPITLGGRVIGATLMIAGMFVIAVFAGVISSTLVGHLIPLQQEQIRMSTLSGHIIIAGWNDNVPMLLKQLEAEYPKDRRPPILLFAPIERPDMLGPDYIFVHGDFTKEDEYAKVRLNYAKTVLVVADTSEGAIKSAARDASTVLTVFTIRRLEGNFDVKRTSPLHICAEILDPENIDHAKTAGANEVMATALVGNSLIAHTASNPGVGSILTDLLLATKNNIYTSPMPMGLIEGKTLLFKTLQEVVRNHHGVLVIGVVQHGEIRMNPDPDFPVLLGDDLVYLGSQQLTTQSKS